MQMAAAFIVGLLAGTFVTAIIVRVRKNAYERYLVQAFMVRGEARQRAIMAPPPVLVPWRGDRE